ncbi:MAG TPA: hypothetical protein PKA77_12545 [Chitinophagaceae bacterium]|jgi:hypothetical protein|nr:hypothetical protein [Chitinophagaceae bacterium]HMU58065.1 hypothetical protein [Chitinophagaceae bacterium]
MRNTEKPEKDDSMPLLFFITGLSAFLFDGIIYILDGSFSPLFTWIGVITISVGILLFVVSNFLPRIKSSPPKRTA